MKAVMALWVLLSSAAVNADVTGIYSSYKFSSESGDLIGAEMFITEGVSSHFATIQCSEGGGGNPILVPLKVAGDIIEFTVPEETSTGCRAGEYRGTVTDQGLHLHNLKFNVKIFLPRGKSFWVKPK